MIHLIRNFVLKAFSDPILFILTYKFTFLMYVFAIILSLYFTRNLCFSDRLYFVSKNFFFMCLVQLVRLLAYYLNHF